MKTKLIALALLLGVFAYSTAQPNRIGNSDVYWELTTQGNDTTLHIFGTGDIPGGSNLKWKSYATAIKHVVIDEGITSICSYGMKDFINLYSVSIPNTMKIISANAFQNDSNMTDINFPDSIYYIGSSAFDYAQLPDTLYLPASLISLQANAFRYTKIKHINIPQNIDTIWVSTFRFSSLSSITFPASLSQIYRYAFDNNRLLTHITCPCMTPPALQDTTVFSNVNRGSCRLTVPAASVQIYKSTPVWQDFLIEAGNGYAIAVTSNNKECGIVQGVENRFYHAGETVTVRAIPLNNGRFGGWKSNGQTISTNTTFSFKVTQDTLITAVFDQEVSIEERQDTRPSVVLYPNPAYDMVQIATDASVNDIIIYDLSGKMIHHLSHSRQIDISGLSKGIYFVKILTDSFTCTKKLVKL